MSDGRLGGRVLLDRCGRRGDCGSVVGDGLHLLLLSRVALPLSRVVVGGGGRTATTCHDPQQAEQRHDRPGERVGPPGASRHRLDGQLGGGDDVAGRVVHEATVCTPAATPVGTSISTFALPASSGAIRPVDTVCPSRSNS